MIRGEKCGRAETSKYRWCDNKQNYSYHISSYIANKDDNTAHHITTNQIIIIPL